METFNDGEEADATTGIAGLINDCNAQYAQIFENFFSKITVQLNDSDAKMREVQMHFIINITSLDSRN